MRYTEGMSRLCFNGVMLACLSVAVVSGSGGTAQAHGGLPISLRILRVPGSTTMSVPVHYWGMWVGQKMAEGYEWRWICEEAINAERFRRYAVSADGIYYATNSKGLSMSRMNGCNWPAATGEIATLKTSDIATDPVDGATAWVTTATGALAGTNGTLTGAPNGLFVTHDHGDTFTRVPGIGTSGRLLTSVRVSPSDPKVLYLSSTDYMAPYGQAIDRSTDGGVTFTSQPLTSITNRGAVSGLELMAVDPHDPSILFARANVMESGKVRQLLLRVERAGDAGQVATELTSIETASLSGKLPSGINDIAFDVAHELIFVATQGGILRGSTKALPITLTKVSTLGQAQCVDVAGDELFACSWNYTPEFAAIAVGDDTGSTMGSIFTFDQTVGPIDCPADTDVQLVCPQIWYTYASELGITKVPDLGTNADMGDGGSDSPDCSYAPGRSGPGGMTLVAGALLLLLARRRYGAGGSQAAPSG